MIVLEKKFKMESLEKQFREAIKVKNDKMKTMNDEIGALVDEKAKLGKSSKRRSWNEIVKRVACVGGKEAGS